MGCHFFGVEFLPSVKEVRLNRQKIFSLLNNRTSYLGSPSYKSQKWVAVFDCKGPKSIALTLTAYRGRINRANGTHSIPIDTSRILNDILRQNKIVRRTPKTI